MVDPVAAAAHALSTVAQDGTWMIVEPFAHDQVKDNLNPVGRLFYAASTMICTPASLDQEVGLALGAQAARHNSLRSSAEAGSPIFGEPPKPHSTSSSKPGRDTNRRNQRRRDHTAAACRNP